MAGRQGSIDCGSKRNAELELSGPGYDDSHIAGSRFDGRAPFQRLGGLGCTFRQELQGHEAPKSGVLGLVNDTHPTTAQLLDDAVVRDGLADQFESGLRHSGGNVRRVAYPSQSPLRASKQSS